MKIQPIKGLVLLLLMASAAACSGIQVSQDYDTRIPFPDMQTYAWKSPEEKTSDDIRENNPLLHKRFHENIDRILTEKGYVRKSDPDFLVDYEYAIKTRIHSEPYTTGFGFGVGRYHRYGGVNIISAPKVYEYDVGTLAIDVYDAGPDTLLWRGMGSEEIAEHPTPEKSTEMVRRIVEAILEQFPPQ
ncbi:MAG TPA: DUF4136 domain-containing protein [Desulfotignum sp.]|nr:DUF4136 domain-containing protein [Desulfotignum sp.]